MRPTTSMIYTAFKYGAIAISLVLIVVGYFKGAVVLAHMGAAVTVIGILLTFAIAPERNRLARAEVIFFARIARETSAAIAALPTQATPAVANLIRRQLMEDFAKTMRAFREHHERRLVTGEAFLLTLETLVWGFADLLPG